MLVYAAEAFYNGNGVWQNYPQAFLLFHKAAEMGHSKSQHYISQMYLTGNGVEQNYTEAAKWLAEADSSSAKLLM